LAKNAAVGYDLPRLRRSAITTDRMLIKQTVWATSVFGLNRRIWLRFASSAVNNCHVFFK